MIDIHTHVLPGIDDGAADLTEAVALCKMAAADGCTELCATPHQHNDRWWNTDADELARLRAELQLAVGATPRIHAGAEIRVSEVLFTSLEGFPASGVLPLAGSRYLLLELDRFGGGPEPETLVYELRIAGWKPILAHPEFIPQLSANLDRFSSLADLGALFQITAMSVTGGFGRKTQRLVEKMLDRGCVHFLASDTHSVDWRPPGLSSARERVAQRWGEPLAHALTVDNPAAVLADQPIQTPTQAGMQ